MISGHLTKRIKSGHLGECGKTCSLIINTNCNFKCDHCFITHKFNENKIMSKEIIDKSFELFDSDFSISILGGEPMLHPNICKYICNKAKEIKADSCIITNSFWVDDEKLTNFLLNEIKPDLVILSTDKWHRQFHPLEKIQKAIDILYGKTQISLELVIESNEKSTLIDKVSLNKEGDILSKLNIKDKEIFVIVNPLRKEGRAVDNNLGPQLSLCNSGICSANGFIIDYNGNFSIKCENSASLKEECKIWNKNILHDTIDMEEFKRFIRNNHLFVDKKFCKEDCFNYKEVFNDSR